MPTLLTETADNNWMPTTLSAGVPLTSVLGELAHLVPIDDGTQRGVVLLVVPGQDAFVNGERLAGHICWLQHKDELVVSGKRHFYSAESQPVIVPFQLTGGQRRPRCAVCRVSIDDAQPAVCCPGCGRMFHEIAAVADRPAKRCWTYNDRCRFCNHPTDLNANTFWTPAAEGGDA